MDILTNETDYNNALNKVNNLMKKGEVNLTNNEFETIRAMANMIKEYEKIHYPFPMPKTIVDMVELKMFEKKINSYK